MPHIASSFWRAGRRAGGRRWCHVKWSRRRRLLKALARATEYKRLPQVLQEEAKEAGAGTTARELLGLPQTSPNKHDRAESEGKIVPAAARTWASWWGKIVRWYRGDCDIPVTPQCENICEPKGSVNVPPSELLATSGGVSRSPLVGVEKDRLVGNSNKGEGELEEEDGKEEEEAVEGNVVEEREADAKAKGKGMQLLDNKHDTEKEDTSKKEAKVGGRGNGEERKEEMLNIKENGEKVEVNYEDGEGEEKEEVEELREEVVVKGGKEGGGGDTEEEEKAELKEDAQEEQVGLEEEWGSGSRRNEGGGEKEEIKVKKNEQEMEEEMMEVVEEEELEEMEVKEESEAEEKGMEEEDQEEMLGEKEGWGQEEDGAKGQDMVEEGEGVGVDEDTSGEDNHVQQQQEDELEESVAVGVGVGASPIVTESSMVANDVQEASRADAANDVYEASRADVANDVQEVSSADVDADSFGFDQEVGSLVPAEFRPVGREDDVLCIWDLSMLSPKTDAASLGSGTYGSVAEMLTESGRVVAMKTVLKRESTEEAITRETELLQDCSGHPHVVSMYGSISTADRLYIIMSKADTTLLALIQNGVVDETRAAECIRQLVSATEFLHARSVIHRDIKPANVLLSNGEVQLADFGSAIRAEEYVSNENDICGSEMYLAPEQLNKLPHGFAVDMWAIGIVAFELLHGVHPFWPNEQQIALALDNSEVNAANWSSTSSSEDSSESPSDASGSSIDVEDVGQVVEAGDWGGVGDGVLSGKEGVGSADVSDVEEAPPLVLGMSPNRFSRIIYATFHARVKAAVFDEKEGLDPVATDFLHQLLHPLPSDRMSAAQAANHAWLNNETDMYAIETWRYSTRASTVGAMAVQRVLRLDAAVFKAQRAAEWVEDAMIEMEARAEGSSVLGQSAYVISPPVVKATMNIVSTLRKCEQLTTTMAAQARKAQTRTQKLEAKIAEGIAETYAHSDAQVGGQGIGMVGSTAEDKADEFVWKAERCAEGAEAQFHAVEEAIVIWEKTVAEAEEEAEAAEVAEAAEAVEAILENRRTFVGQESAWYRMGKAQAVGGKARDAGMVTAPWSKEEDEKENLAASWRGSGGSG